MSCFFYSFASLSEPLQLSPDRELVFSGPPCGQRTPTRVSLLCNRGQPFVPTVRIKLVPSVSGRVPQWISMSKNCTTMSAVDNNKRPWNHNKPVGSQSYRLRLVPDTPCRQADKKGFSHQIFVESITCMNISTTTNIFSQGSVDPTLVAGIGR